MSKFLATSPELRTCPRPLRRGVLRSQGPFPPRCLPPTRHAPPPKPAQEWSRLPKALTRYCRAPCGEARLLRPTYSHAKPQAPAHTCPSVCLTEARTSVFLATDTHTVLVRPTLPYFRGKRPQGRGRGRSRPAQGTDHHLPASTPRPCGGPPHGYTAPADPAPRGACAREHRHRDARMSGTHARKRRRARRGSLAAEQARASCQCPATAARKCVTTSGRASTGSPPPL